MQGAANKMLLISTGSIKPNHPTIKNEMKNARMILLVNLMEQRNDRDQSESQKCSTADSCLGLVSHRLEVIARLSTLLTELPSSFFQRFSMI